MYRKPPSRIFSNVCTPIGYLRVCSIIRMSFVSVLIKYILTN